MKGEVISRREFVVKTSKASAALVAVSSFLNPCILGTASPAANDTLNTITLDLTKSAHATLKKVGGAMYVDNPNEGNPIIVHRISPTKVVAFSSTCTHMGCRVPLPANNLIVCLCHGSKYDGEGNRISGLAPSGLTKYPAALKGNKITIAV
jgi:Rieske Fe-S protein